MAQCITEQYSNGTMLRKLTSDNKDPITKVWSKVQTGFTETRERFEL